MYVITVIPISRGIGKETLSYFTASKTELGSMVSVPLRKKMIDALVTECKDAKNMRSELRSADFVLKKIDRLVSRPFLSPAFMKTVEATAKWHVATIGATLNVLLPKKIFKKGIPFHFTKKAETQKKKKQGFEIIEVRGTLSERIDGYLSKIKNTDGVIIVPTKERQTLFKKLLHPVNPSTLVLLPSELVEIPPNTSTIIIEEENSSSYKSFARPFIDFRFAIEKYAENIGAQLVKGNESPDFKIEKIIEEHVKEDTRPLTSIGRNLERDLKNMKDSGVGHLFILATRRGHSGTVLCGDCGTTVNCKRCSAPLTLHLKKAKEEFNNLLCHHCGYRDTALMKCEKCGSWKLKAYGLGVEKIEEDIKAIVKKHNVGSYIQRIDSTLSLTPKRIRDFVATHYEKESSILIGTEIVLPYLVDATLEQKQNDSSYIASLDTLLSLPDFSINEKIWKLLCQLDDITKNKVVVQTRNIKNTLLVAWKSNSEKENKNFWKQELEERKTFNYPPHGVVIKITVKGKKDVIAHEMKKIENRVEKWKPMIFPAFIKTINNQHILHALIALPKEHWVDEELSDILLSLPQSIRIEVNPRSLL
jgi:primosomal protein N'